MIWHELKSLRFHKRNIAVLAIQTCMAKRVRSSKNQQVQPYEKHQLLQIWTNPKLTSFSKKARSMVISIPHVQEYPDFQDISTIHDLVRGYWGCLLGVMYQYFKRLGHKKNMGLAKVYSTTWLTIHYIENR